MEATSITQATNTINGRLKNLTANWTKSLITEDPFTPSAWVRAIPLPSENCMLFF
jgi:hypothetical protein